MNYQFLREACCEANRALLRTGLVDLTFGNVSLLDADKGVFAIKPSGVAYSALTPADIVVVDLEGRVVEGSLRPSSDTPTHRCLFLAFKEEGIRSVVHTHSRSAVAFAQCGRELPCLGTTHADHFDGSIPCTRWMTQEEVRADYEWNTGQVIVERFRQSSIHPGKVPAVFVRGHGPFTWGGSVHLALEYAQALEICADMALKTLALQPQPDTLPDVMLRKHFDRKHGVTAYYGQ